MTDQPSSPLEPPGDLAARIRAVLAADPELHGAVEQRRMFGRLAFLVRGSLLATASPDGLLIRCGPDQRDRILTLEGAVPATRGQRSMGPAWIHVAAEALDESALEVLLAAALE